MIYQVNYCYYLVVQGKLWEENKDFGVDMLIMKYVLVYSLSLKRWLFYFINRYFFI